MFFNHLRIAFRNIFKRKGYSFLNIMGLTIGMSCCSSGFSISVSYERSYDRFEPKAGQIVSGVRLGTVIRRAYSPISQRRASYPAIGSNDEKGFSGSGKVLQTER